MENTYEKNRVSVNTLFHVLYTSLQGNKSQYKDVVHKAKQLLPIVLPDLIASPDRNAR